MSARHTHRALTAAAAVVIDRLESRTMLGAHPAGLWVIAGDRYGATDDAIVVKPGGFSPDKLIARVNGKVVGIKRAAQVRRIQINGLAGDDDISVDFTEAYNRTIVSVNGGMGDDLIQGGAGGEFLSGGGGRDTINGGMGDDRIDGGSANDLLSGEEGDDIIEGGSGMDVEAGGMGDDSLSGDAGNDKLSGGWGEDDLDGDAGSDVLRGGDGADNLDGGPDADIVYREKVDYWHNSRWDTAREDERANPLEQVADDAALKQWVIDAAVEEYQWAFGNKVQWWGMPWKYRGRYYALSGMDMGASNGETGGAAPATNSDYSQTNNQVSGVDEMDLVKTDGNYIYLLQNNKLIIVSAAADQSTIVAQVDLPDSPQGIYLDGSRLSVVSSAWVADETYPVEPPLPVDGGIVADRMFCPVWWSSREETTVTVYDVAEATTPAQLWKTTIDGGLRSSRDIDGRMYLVIDGTLNAPRPLAIGEEGEQVYETEEVYRARLDGMALDELLPQYKTEMPDGTVTGGGSMVTSGNLWLPASESDDTSLFTAALLDVNGTGEITDTESVGGVSGEIYASAGSMYVSAQGWDSPMGRWTGDYRTDIYRLSLGATSIDFQGNGTVPGWVVDQFSMDEYSTNEDKSYFRIATTSSQDGLSNSIFVLEDTGSTLDIVGSLTELALTERIYSARFVGNRGYLVTFRQTDPLFTIDMTDPHSPELKGVLEMPGYSSYLHPVGDNLLIGFGRDADLSGRVRGLQVSLFDVSNIADPRRIDVMKLTQAGWWSGNSAAEWDHHAFSYFAEYGVLALPVLDYGWWHNSAKLAIIKVDPTEGFMKIGQIEHQGEVLRSLRVGEYLYSVGTDAVKVVKINDPETELASVALPQAQPVPPGVVVDYVG